MGTVFGGSFVFSVIVFVCVLLSVVFRLIRRRRGGLTLGRVILIILVMVILIFTAVLIGRMTTAAMG